MKAHLLTREKSQLIAERNYQNKENDHKKLQAKIK